MIETGVVTHIPKVLSENRGLEAQEHLDIKTLIEALQMSTGQISPPPPMVDVDSAALATVLDAVKAIPVPIVACLGMMSGLYSKVVSRQQRLPPDVIAGMREIPQILSGVR